MLAFDLKTLLVDCYLQDAESKMKFYRQMCAEHSEIVEVKLAELPQVNFDGIDAVVLSGSQWMLSEKEPPNELIGFLHRLQIPTLGICFGHQLLAWCFGAEVKKGERLIEQDEVIRIIEKWEIFAGLGELNGQGLVIMRESHQEFVAPESIKRIGWQIGAVSDSCPVEAIRHPSLPLYGVQFHPERSGAAGKKLFYNFYRNVVSKTLD